MKFILLLLVSHLFSQTESCSLSNIELINSRSIYSVGDTLSFEDQNMLYDVCNGSGDYQTGDSFSLIDFNGSHNGGDYNIMLISMNATW